MKNWRLIDPSLINCNYVSVSKFPFESPLSLHRTHSYNPIINGSYQLSHYCTRQVGTELTHLVSSANSITLQQDDCHHRHKVLPNCSYITIQSSINRPGHFIEPTMAKHMNSPINREIFRMQENHDSIFRATKKRDMRMRVANGIPLILSSIQSRADNNENHFAMINKGNYESNLV